jgi:hypothetical protein
VFLGAAANYVILAKAGISSVPGSVITGDIAVSPAAISYVTGFSLTSDSSGKFSTSTQVVDGVVKGADQISPTPSQLTTAISAMETAYTAAKGLSCPAANIIKTDLSGAYDRGKIRVNFYF